MRRPNGDPFDDRDPSPILVPYDEITLVEQNRGKAGALNVYKDFLTVKAASWVAQNDIPGYIQIFMGIMDARHMLAEPEIFWNDAFPFFARNKDSGESAKDYGELSTTQQCIMVQYPQFFTNVTRDDFLDNKNSAYYTIWQTLRDCGKCITSSGTNAIWSAYRAFYNFSLLRLGKLRIPVSHTPPLLVLKTQVDLSLDTITLVSSRHFAKIHPAVRIRAPPLFRCLWRRETN